jgi:pimeloyl-ACP methyl ester carboxylesterase
VVADGWAWRDHRRVERRTVFATLAEYPLTASVSVAVQPKPVVLVHGFNSGAWAWHAWTGPDGFLAARGLQGFAVGDGQFGIEPMNTGDFTQPRKPTNTIAENAAILARYVEAVRRATGADRVDLVGHSMGGLISRYYIATLMPVVERPGLTTVPVVNQLYMIGTPNAGSTCAIPAASLGLYPPATTEITPAYVQLIFNREINDPRGVPFFVLAGDPVRDYAALVCTPVPTDVFVSVASAEGAIPVTATELPVRHGEQTGSPQVFEAVFQSLSRGPDEYPIPLPTEPARPLEEMEELQIAGLHSGTLAPDGRVTVPVEVDQSKVVSFMLYAPGQDVEMRLITSRGRDLRPETAPELPDVTRQKDGGPGTTVTEGFRIKRPETGTWQVVLTPKAGVQSEGAIWAVAVFVQSDLRLAGQARPTVVEASQAVMLRAVLTGPADPASTTVRAVIRDATGRVVAELSLLDDGAHEDDGAGDGVFGGSWTAEVAGLYTVTLTAAGQRADGDAFQRVTVVAVRVVD